MKKIAFLDRDGVINKEVNYLHEIAKFEFTPGCIDGLKILQDYGFEFIIITNQAGIARGYYTVEDYHHLTDFYLKKLKSFGIDILDVFYCPHHKDGVIKKYSLDCVCRKPSTGMLTAACEKYNIDLSQSILIGDKLSDVEAGAAFNVSRNFLVETGHEVPEISNEFVVFPTLLELARNGKF
nr:HAD family hydrolase [uncultured Vibrio sp.]